MSYLDTLEKFYIDFVNKNNKEPKGFVCNEKTLDKILEDFWDSLIIKGGESKSDFKNRIKGEGVRFRGILIGIGVFVFDDDIFIQ